MSFPRSTASVSTRSTSARRLGSGPHIGRKVTERAAADGEAIQRVDHSRDVAAAQVGRSDLVGDKCRSAAPEIAATAIHMGDEGPPGAVAKGDRVLVDKAHVAGLVMGQAADRALRNLAGEQLREL